MNKGRRKHPRKRTRKHWLAGGVIAAGLGAAMVTGAAPASGSTDAASNSSVSADTTSSGSSEDKTSALGRGAMASQRNESDVERADAGGSKGRDDGGGTDGGPRDLDQDDETDVAADGHDETDAAADDRDAAEDADENTTEGAVPEESTGEEVTLDEGIAEDVTVDGDFLNDAGEQVIEEVTDQNTAENDGAAPDGSDAAGSGIDTPVADTRDGGDAAPVTVAQPQAAEPVTTAVTLRTTAAAETDPVLLAAALSTKVTWGSMIVDWLYSIGIRSKRMGTDWLDVPVSKAAEARWLVKRSFIYRNVVIPQPGDPQPGDPQPGDPQTGNPSSPTLLWETNFSSMEEALRYWGLHTGRWGQSAGENQYYTDGDNVYIDADGNLVIEARRERAPDGLGAPYNYTSARVVTMGKQSIGVGTRVVARIQMPVTKGVLPAFWSVGLEPGHEYDWPRQGEIDIVEVPGMGTPASRRIWTGNIHGPSESDNSVDVKLHGVDADLGVDLSQGFHDYGMDWYSDRIIWHVDGVEVGRVTQAEYEALGGDWTPFSGAWDHYLILNVAVGNPWTGDPNPAEPFNAQMKVDWVKAYSL